MRTLYAPVFFFGFISAALCLVASSASPLWLLPLLATAVGVSFTCERLFPYKAAWNQPQGEGSRDLCHALVNECLNIGSVATIPLFALWLPQTGLWPAHWPLALQWLLAVVVADLGITLVHYASHRSPLLWRLHAVHHSVTRMYGFNGLMKHPLHQLLEALAGTLPLLLIGLPWEVALLLATSTCRAEVMTFASSARNHSTTALPIPLVPPVTRTRLPVNPEFSMARSPARGIDGLRRRFFSRR